MKNVANERLAAQFAAAADGTVIFSFTSC